MKSFVIPDYSDDDLKQAFSPEEWIEIMEHLGYKLNKDKKNELKDKLKYDQRR